MLNIRTFRARFDGLSAKQRALFAVSYAAIFLWLTAILLVLNEAQVDILSEYQVDKLVHFGGGVFAAALLYSVFDINKRKQTLYLTLFVGVLWEIGEILFLPDQLSRFRHDFFWWFSDTAFDLIADVIGAYFWINLFMYSPNAAAETVSPAAE